MRFLKYLVPMGSGGSGASGGGDGGVEEKVAEVAEKVAGGLDKAAEEMGERDDAVDEIVKTTAEAAEAASDAAKAASDIKEAVDAVERGDAADAVGHSLAATGDIADGLGDVAEGIADAVGEGPVAEVLGTVAEVAGTVGGVARALEGPVRDVLRSILGDPADAVKYRFAVDTLANARWAVTRVLLEEALDAPYDLQIQVSTEDRDLEVATLLGRDVTLDIERRPDFRRRVCGVVQQIDESSLREGVNKAIVTLRVRPAVALLGLRSDTRIFQRKTVPEILETVLGEGLSPYRREVRLELEETYLAREYCVQFEESDLSFAERLMQEEGIAYRFEHAGERETLVLVDRNGTFPKVETLDDNTIPYVPRADITQDRENIFSFVSAHRMTSTKVALRDFDWTQQGTMRIDAERGGGEEGGGQEGDASASQASGVERDVYIHHERVLTITDYDQGVAKYQRQDAERQARIRHELEVRDGRIATGLGRVVHFCPGTTFTLSGHPNVGADGDYMITRVIHENARLPTGGDEQIERYHNRFECTPLGVPYRPRVTAHKPRIHSVQTAVVVGPPGEEIHTDEHGRIKVEFHWDRKGQRDDASSCWLRVQQPWAGSGWGFVFVPRVGMEVLVSFLDGDPDRPLVVGSVYDGNNVPPYPLPDEKTKSTIKTRSTPGGDGFNELRFEDRAGSEEIFTHAQRDYNEVVLHDHTTTVGNDQANSVDCNQTQTIGANQTEHVGGEQSMTVAKNRTVHIEGSQSVKIDGGEANAGVTGSKLDITGDYQVDASGWIEAQAPERIRLTCGGSSILIEPGKITLTAGGQAQVVLDADALLQSSAGSQAKLDANAVMGASTGGSLQLSADAKMSGANSEVAGSATAKVGAPTATLAGGGGSVEAGGAGVTAAGGKVSVSGGMVDVTGGLVKIN